ncbi:MAG TPA: Hpt domain-containing protein [Thermoanaerobaculia bacterium]|nr:Hpt domain-containing protein [Thermoanaerobaculia bacterium]
MTNVQAAVEKQIAALRQRFVAKLPERIAAITTALEDGSELREIQRLFHSLAGTAATYKLEEVAAVAWEGEDECVEEKRDGLRAIVERLRGIATPQPASVLSLSAGAGERSNLIPGGRSVLIASADLSAELLRRRVASEGFHVIVVTALTAAREAFAQRISAIVIASVDLASDVITALRESRGGASAVAFVLGTPRTFVERIRMLHCGADGAFADSNDIDAIVQTICAAQTTPSVSCPRILCVDDDPEYVAWVRAVLGGAGYEFLALNDPVHFEGTLAAFQPDLLLLDIVLPDVSRADAALYAAKENGRARVQAAA